MESDGSMAGIGIDRDGCMFGSCWHLAKFVLKAAWRRDDQALQLARRLTWELDGRLRDHAAAGPLVLPEVPLQELIPETELGVGTGELRIEDGGTGPYDASASPRSRVACGRGTCSRSGRSGARRQLCWPATRRPRRGSSRSISKLGRPGTCAFSRLRATSSTSTRPASGSTSTAGPSGGKITQLLGDSTTFDYTPHQGRCDLVFVDAAHSYDFVRSDTANAFKLLAPGGVILWHDYKVGCPGVVRALHEVRVAGQLQHIIGTTLVVYGLMRPAQSAYTTPGATAQLWGKGVRHLPDSPPQRSSIIMLAGKPRPVPADNVCS